MPVFKRDDVELYYEEHGTGFPVLLIAPGGMRSDVSFWERTPWNPIEQLAPNYRVIAMDQRNAGKSVAPVRPSDSWHVYTADQLALLDHLGIDRFHVAGMCIGGPYIMGLIKAAPQRVVSAVGVPTIRPAAQRPRRVGAAVVFQALGLDGNRQAFFEMFDSWANELRPTRPEVSGATWESFKKSMYGGDFLFNVSREFVSRC